MTDMKVPFDKQATRGLNWADKNFPVAFTPLMFLLTLPAWVLLTTIGFLVADEKPAKHNRFFVDDRKRR